MTQCTSVYFVSAPAAAAHCIGKDHTSNGVHVLIIGAAYYFYPELLYHKAMAYAAIA
jgi:hypothetical protein